MIFFRSSEFRTLSDLKHCVILVTDSLTRRKFQDSVGFEAPCCDDSIARDHLQPGVVKRQFKVAHSTSG